MKPNKRPSPVPPKPKSDLERYGPWIAIVLAGLLAYGGSLRNGFTYDDALVIRRAGPQLAHPSWNAFFSRDYFLYSQESTYRPVVTLTYVVDHALGGERPFAYHLQNLLWHLGSALLLFELFRSRFGSSRARAAWIAGMIFAIHPILSEAVNNASFREDLLVTFFVLLALRLRLSDRIQERLWAPLPLAIALFSKESAVVAVVLLVAARVWTGESRKSERQKLFGDLVAFGLTTFFYLVLRFGPFASPGTYAEYAGGSWGATLMAMPRVAFHYARLLVVPWKLCASYTGVFPFGAKAISVAWFLGLGVIALLIVAPFKLGRKRPDLAFGALWFGVCLLPVSNLVAIPEPVAERFLYLPVVGAVWLAGVGLSWGWDQLRGREGWKRWTLLGSGVAVALTFVVLANLRNRAWHDDVTLWTQTVQDFPESWGAHHGLGTSLMEEENSLDLALLHLQLAIDGKPGRQQESMVLNDLGIVYGKLGRFSESAMALKRSLEEEPRAVGFYNLGLTYENLGQAKEAEDALRKAIDLDAYYARAFAMLASLKHREHQDREAGALMAHARELNPRDQVVRTESERITRPAEPITPPMALPSMPGKAPGMGAGTQGMGTGMQGMGTMGPGMGTMGAGMQGMGNMGPGMGGPMGAGMGGFGQRRSFFGGPRPGAGPWNARNYGSNPNLPAGFPANMPMQQMPVQQMPTQQVNGQAPAAQ
jgi:Flp pilus assembly protein TadD